MKKFAIIALAAIAAGCGVSDDKLLTEIDADLWTKICDKATADSEAVSCDGFEIPATTSAECVTANNGTWTGTCTFGTWRECQEWEPEDDCDPGDPPAACTTLFDCIDMGDM